MSSTLKRCFVFANLLMAAALIGCGGGDDSTLSISSFSPASGPVGTTVTVAGTSFDATATNNAVKFNGTTASVSSSTTTQIITAVPSGATTGPISVTVGGSAVSSTTNFTVSPAITGLSPASGTIGASVTITGTSFDATPANNTVKFNGAPAIVTSSTSTSIVTTVPVGATTGPVTVTVNGQMATSPVNFTVN